MFTSMVGCMSAFLVHHMMIGDLTKNTRYFLSLGLSEEQIKTAKVAWTGLTESMVNRDLHGIEYSHQNHLVLGGDCCMIGPCPR